MPTAVSYTHLGVPVKRHRTTMIVSMRKQMRKSQSVFFLTYRTDRPGKVNWNK